MRNEINDKYKYRLEIETSLKVYSFLSLMVILFSYGGPVAGLFAFPSTVIAYLNGSGPFWQVCLTFFLLTGWIITLYIRKPVLERYFDLKDKIKQLD